MFLADARISFDALDRERLVGGSVDLPRPGQASPAVSLRLEGWVVGRTAPVQWVEVAANDRTLLRTRPRFERPDVGVAIGDAAAARSCGFRGTVDVSSSAVERLVVRARLATGGIATLASIEVKRFWRAGTHPAERDVASIVIPCYNQAHFLPDAIESALAQNHPSIEVVVVDDGSPDNTAEVVARYPTVKYVAQPHTGLAAARNTGIRHSNGEFLLFLDADDRLRPNAVGTGIRLLREHADWAFVSGEHCYTGVDGTVIGCWTRAAVERDHYAALLESNYIACPGAVLHRRAALHATGGFDPRFNGCEDYELYLRTARQFPVGAHDAVAVEYRRHHGSLSGEPGIMLEGALHALDVQPAMEHAPALRRARQRGRRYWREYYGKPLAARARRHLLTPGRRLDGLRALLRLARLAPGQLPHVLVGGD
jgi:hypothetical protein